MNWITGMQRAIDYLEENLTGTVDYQEAARRACVSSFYFQRVFSLLCGYSVGEYLRFRRLTLAGSELLSTDQRILDIALKYGYDSHESFTRAFTRFHGVTPAAAKTGLVPLNSFARLSIQISLKGGEIMKYQVQQREAFKIIGKVKTFSTEDGANAQEIPRFWDQCNRDGTTKWLAQHRRRDGIFGSVILGACMEDTRRSTQFPYAIAAEYDGGEVPEGFTVWEVPAMTWVCFDAAGTMPQAIQQLWHRVFAEFFPTSDYRPAGFDKQYGAFDLEVYSDGDMSDEEYHSSIWVAVTKNGQPLPDKRTQI